MSGLIAITGLISIIFGLLLGYNIGKRDRARIIFYGALWILFAGATIALLLD